MNNNDCISFSTVEANRKKQVKYKMSQWTATVNSQCEHATSMYNMLLNDSLNNFITNLLVVTGLVFWPSLVTVAK